MAKLVQALGDSSVSSDPVDLMRYEHDLTGRFQGTPRAVVRPASIVEVARTVAICNDDGTAVVPRGGGTSLVGGAVAQRDEIILSLERLDAVEPVDTLGRQLTADAGSTLEAVQRQARSAALELPIDFPARSAATIGGMIATNAGGAMALRHGPMRARVAGLEAVLPDGSVISRLNGLIKDTAGYDLPALLVGSEGTLAVITRARLHLKQIPPHRMAALIGRPTMAAAIDTVSEINAALGGALECADFFDRSGMDLVLGRMRLRDPLPHEHHVYLVVTLAGSDLDLADRLVDALGPDATDAVAAEGTTGISDLWRYREQLNESITATGLAHKLDVSLPLARIAEFTEDLHGLIRRHDSAHLVLYGHLGDGNLHVNVLGLERDDLDFDEQILRLVAAHDGSISAEHGIGMAKRGYLGLTRSEPEIHAMRAIKRALDPNGTLSPGRVLAPARFGDRR